MEPEPECSVNFPLTGRSKCWGLPGHTELANKFSRAERAPGLPGAITGLLRKGHVYGWGGGWREKQ